VFDHGARLRRQFIGVEDSKVVREHGF